MDALVSALLQPTAYPQETCSQIQLIETHISWVFLTAEYAYKVKKPVRNDFLDYSTLERRRRLCYEELRLDRRYAPELYVDVVTITRQADGFQIAGAGEVCEYAVKMRRFTSDALLSHRLERGLVDSQDIKRLAASIAAFHAAALRADVNTDRGVPDSVVQDAVDNLDALESLGLVSSELPRLRRWTLEMGKRLRPCFEQRRQQGMIRECHGDLHTGNIVQWQGGLTPFDGIEFCDGFRWIDVLSDVGFLAMDLQAKQHPAFAYLLLSTYLEATGDYEHVELLRWYQVYRALVRAKVDGLLLRQQAAGSPAAVEAWQDGHTLIDLAQRLTQSAPGQLWLTFGASGSGKSTGAERLVERNGLIRLRADVERKRLLGKPADYRPTSAETAAFYSEAASRRTYTHLRDLAERILQAGYGVVVDATFLKGWQRELFFSLADDAHVPLNILKFEADPAILAQRIRSRAEHAQDASDADEDVLRRQLASCDPLSEREQARAVEAGAWMASW